MLTLLIMLIPIVLGSNAYALENNDFEQLDKRIQSFDNLLNEEQLQLGKINFEISSINNDFENLQNSIDISMNYFEFSKYDKLANKYLELSQKLRNSLNDKQKELEMNDILLSVQIRKNISNFQISDSKLTNNIQTHIHLEKERLMSESRQYIQNTLTEAVVEKHFESYSPQYSWLDIYKIAFNKIQRDEKFNALPMTIDRLMMQYQDEDLLRELLLLRLDIELLLDSISQTQTYTQDDDSPPVQEEPEEEETPPGEIIPYPRTSIGELNLTVNEAISQTISQITNIVDDHEQELQSKRLQSSYISSSKSSSLSGSGGSGETGHGDRPRDNKKSDF